MWQKFETRALRLDSPATASSLGILMMLAQSTSVAAQDPTVTTPPHQNPTLATLVVTGAEATEAQKAEKQLRKVPGQTAVVDNREYGGPGAKDVSAVPPSSRAGRSHGFCGDHKRALNTELHECL